MLLLADLRWPEGAGIGVVKREMVRRMPSHFDLVDLGVAVGVGSPRSPFCIARAIRKWRHEHSVFWTPGFMPSSAHEVPSVVTVHDLTHLHFHSRLHALYYSVVLRSFYRATSEIVCVSDYTRQEFLGWSGMDPRHVTTVYNSVSQEFSGSTVAARSLPFEYVLYPGNHRGNKNTDRLVRAYAQSALPGAGIRLVFTGNANPKLLRLANCLNIADKIHYVGFVPDGELNTLYRHAKLIAYVSLYEGFGLPILEGMSVGVPVLTSNVSAMPEVAGGAALVVDPYSEDAIAAGLNTLVFDETSRAFYVGLGNARIKEFSWDRSAAELWSIVERACAGSRVKA